MKRRILGGTGISVSEFALGAMMFGAMGNPDHDESTQMVHTALDAGINFIDTADVYSNGESEKIVGRAIKGCREEILVATKFGLPMDSNPDHRGGSRRWINRAVEASLRRLDTDYIDLYQMHRPDPRTEIEESLSALSDLVRSGKVRAIGSSTFPAELVVEAQWAAHRGGHQRFLTEQPPYSILVRGAEAAVFPTTQRHNMGVLTWSPLASGWLSGRADPTAATGVFRTTMGHHLFDIANPANQAKLKAVKQLTKLANDAGLRLAHLATAFVASHPAVTSVLIGPRTPTHLDELLARAGTVLDQEILDRIDEIVPPGTDLNNSETFYTPPALTYKDHRRRSHPYYEQPDPEIDPVKATRGNG